MTRDLLCLLVQSLKTTRSSKWRRAPSVQAFSKDSTPTTNRAMNLEMPESRYSPIKSVTVCMCSGQHEAPAWALPRHPGASAGLLRESPLLTLCSRFSPSWQMLQQLGVGLASHPSLQSFACTRTPNLEYAGAFERMDGSGFDAVLMGVAQVRGISPRCKGEQGRWSMLCYEAMKHGVEDVLVKR